MAGFIDGYIPLRVIQDGYKKYFVGVQDVIYC